jgi:hypothetical protein
MVLGHISVLVNLWTTTGHDVYSMLVSALPKPDYRTNRSLGLIRNNYLLNKQMIIDNSCLGLANTQDERFTPFLVITHLFWSSRPKGMTVDIWIRDYNPPRCFQKKISGRSKHNGKGHLCFCPKEGLI